LYHDFTSFYFYSLNLICLFGIGGVTWFFKFGWKTQSMYFSQLEQTREVEKNLK